MAFQIISDDIREKVKVKLTKVIKKNTKDINIEFNDKINNIYYIKNKMELKSYVKVNSKIKKSFTTAPIVAFYMDSLSGSFSLVDEFNEYFFDLEKDFYDYLNEIKYDYEKCSLCSALINYRRNKANELKSNEYMIFTNDTLIAIVENKPKTKEELLNTYGFSNKRYCKFGNDIIKIVLNN